MQCVIHDSLVSFDMGAPSKETQTLDRDNDVLCRGRRWQLSILDGKTVKPIMSMSIWNNDLFASSCWDNQEEWPLLKRDLLERNIKEYQRYMTAGLLDTPSVKDT